MITIKGLLDTNQDKPVTETNSVPTEQINLYANLLEYDDFVKNFPQAKKELVSLINKKRLLYKIN